MDTTSTFVTRRRLAGMLGLAAGLLLSGCGTVQQAQQAVSTVQAAATTVSKATSPTGAPSGTATPAGKAPTPAGTPGVRPTLTPRPSPTPAPAVPAGTVVTVDNVKLAASNLRAWTPPDPEWWPIIGHQFVQFDVSYQNTGNEQVTVRDPLFSAVENETGAALSGIAKALDANSGGLIAFSRRGPEIDDKPIQLKAGESRTITRTLQVPIGTKKLVYAEGMMSQRGALAGNPFPGGRWDLGAPPAPPAVRADVTAKIGDAIKTDWNMQVKVNEAALFTPDSEKSMLLGLKIKDDEAIVRVNASMGNPGTARVRIEPGGQIELQDASGKLYNGGLTLIPVDNALGPVELRPQTQAVGNLLFIVPKRVLGELSVRFHPRYGHGNVVVPLGKLG